MKFYWRRVWGLGAAWEFTHVASDDVKHARIEAHVKVFLGPLLITANVPITHWKPL